MMAIRLMTAADISVGMRLKDQAGWNQTAADWRRFLELEPEGCFVAELDGVPAATTTTCVFGPVAWIAMVLVDATLRGRGIGTALMRHALDHLDRRGVTCVRLDATPLGQPLYAKLRFRADYSLARFEGIAQAQPAVPGVSRLNSDKLDSLFRLDRCATGTDRRKLLSALIADRPEAWRMAEGRQGPGFLFSRAGGLAVQIGPCLADAEIGRLLFQDAWNRHAGQRVFVDVPLDTTSAVRWVEQEGLTVQRQLLRMSRGGRVPERRELIWASSGPEKG